MNAGRKLLAAVTTVQTPLAATSVDAGLGLDWARTATHVKVSGILEALVSSCCRQVVVVDRWMCK